MNLSKLTPHHITLLRHLITDGCGNAELARRTHTTEGMIKNAFTVIFNVTGMSTKVELVLHIFNDEEAKNRILNGGL